MSLNNIFGGLPPLPGGVVNGLPQHPVVTNHSVNPLMPPSPLLLSPVPPPVSSLSSSSSSSSGTCPQSSASTHCGGIQTTTSAFNFLRPFAFPDYGLPPPPPIPGEFNRTVSLVSCLDQDVATNAAASVVGVPIASGRNFRAHIDCQIGIFLDVHSSWL